MMLMITQHIQITLAFINSNNKNNKKYLNIIKKSLFQNLMKLPSEAGVNRHSSFMLYITSLSVQTIIVDLKLFNEIF